MIQFVKEFEDPCTEQFANDVKIGLLCVPSPDGYPHITLITTLSVRSKTSLMWGQFSQGLSKEYLKENPKTGFLVVSPDQHWWTGKCLHTGTTIKGDDFVFFNNKPTYRYNAYAGIGVVHYHDLVDVSIGQSFPALEIAAGFTVSKLLKGRVKGGDGIEKLSPFGMELGTQISTLKFLAYIDTDGYPRIIPALQGFAPDPGHVVFSSFPWGDLLGKIPPGAKTALFLVNMDCQCILVQGLWSGFQGIGCLKGAVLDIDKVYNSMLPLSRYIYPPEPLPNVYGIPA
jgi:hypothetical protein